MKKLIMLVMILLIITGSASVFAATDQEVFDQLVGTLVGAMEDDFSLLLSGLGSDFNPILMQNAMIGNNMGMAELGSEKFNNFYFSLLPTISFTAANGVFAFRNTQDYEDSLVLKGLLDNLLFDEEDGLLGSLMANEDTALIADILLNKATPIPAFKLNAGAKLPLNLEVLLHGMWVPSALMGLIPDSIAENLPGGELPTFNYLNIGGEVRYVLLRDSKKTPGLSIGLVGAYNHLLLDIGLGSLLNEALGGALDSNPDPSSNPFDSAGLTIESSAVVFGINTTISKKLAIFYPFLKLGAWYGITEFGGEVVLTDDAKISGGAESNELNLLVSTGFDTMIGPFGTNLAVDYNLASGVWGLNLGSRLQF